jgi:hypothetical protein
MRQARFQSRKVSIESGESEKCEVPSFSICKVATWDTLNDRPGFSYTPCAPHPWDVDQKSVGTLVDRMEVVTSVVWVAKVHLV